MARNDLYVHRTTFCSHACPSDHCDTMLTKLRSRHWVPSLPPLSIWDNQEEMLTCMLELAGIDWRGALVSAGQACHTPCPCHASQPQSSHTDANQGRLPQKWFLKNVSKLQKRNWQEKSSFNQKKITQYVLFKIDKIEVCDNKCTPTIMQLWCKVPWLSPWPASPDMRMATACLSACR